MSEAELLAKCHDFGCDAPALHKRLDALEAELAMRKDTEAEFNLRGDEINSLLADNKRAEIELLQIHTLLMSIGDADTTPKVDDTMTVSLLRQLIERYRRALTRIPPYSKPFTEDVP